MYSEYDQFMRVTDNLSELAFKVSIAIEQVLAEEKLPQSFDERCLIDGGKAGDKGLNYSKLAQRLLERLGIAPHILQKALNDLVRASLMLEVGAVWSGVGEGILQNDIARYGKEYLSWVMNTPNQPN